MAKNYIIITANLITFLDLKSWELSIMIFLGNPNLERIMFSRNWIIASSIAYLVGIASTHLVK